MSNWLPTEMERMMKKRFAVLVLLGMTACLVGCGKADKEQKDNQTENNKVTETEASTVESAVDLLEKVWATYGAEEKFAAVGGDTNNSVEDAPGKYDYEAAEELDTALGFPAEEAGKIDDCASLIHMMNANTFTGAAYHVTDPADVDALVTVLKENILGRRWMCGFPELLLIVQVEDDYVVTAFGNGEVMELFQKKLTAQYPDAKIVVEEPIE